MEYYKNKFGVEYVYCNHSRTSYLEHNHVSVYTITLLLSGELMLVKQNNQYKLEPNMLFIIKPYESHSLLLKSNYYDMMSVCINKNIIDNGYINELKAVIIKDMDYFISKRILDSEQVLLILDSLDKVNLIKKEVYRQVNINLLLGLIEGNPENTLNIDQMSEKTNISKYHLIREFKKEVGLTPHKFQVQNRIRKSQHLINNKYSIIEAGLIAGFYDQSHFIRYFKNIVGITPTEYRKSYVNIPKK